jgi:hypothetical protein
MNNWHCFKGNLKLWSYLDTKTKYKKSWPIFKNVDDLSKSFVSEQQQQVYFHHLKQHASRFMVIFMKSLKIYLKVKYLEVNKKVNYTLLTKRDQNMQK